MKKGRYLDLDQKIPYRAIHKDTDTPLCNRPSGIFILAGFSGKNHWVGQIPTGSA